MLLAQFFIIYKRLIESLSVAGGWVIEILFLGWTTAQGNQGFTTCKFLWHNLVEWICPLYLILVLSCLLLQLVGGSVFKVSSSSLLFSVVSKYETAFNHYSLFWLKYLLLYYHFVTIVNFTNVFAFGKCFLELPVQNLAHKVSFPVKGREY